MPDPSPFAELRDLLADPLATCAFWASKARYLHGHDKLSGPIPTTMSHIVIDDIRALLAERDALAARVAEMEKALNQIASWPEGETVGSWFDEPGSAQIARDALKKEDGNA